jgi:hypothetical protein
MFRLPPARLTVKQLKNAKLPRNYIGVITARFYRLSTEQIIMNYDAWSETVLSKISGSQHMHWLDKFLKTAIFT